MEAQALFADVARRAAALERLTGNGQTQRLVYVAQHLEAGDLTSAARTRDIIAAELAVARRQRRELVVLWVLASLSFLSALGLLWAGYGPAALLCVVLALFWLRVIAA